MSSVRALRARSVSPQSRSPFSAFVYMFVHRAYLNTQKYGLFWSLLFDQRLTSHNVQFLETNNCQLKGQCPDYAHARASSVFSSKDNRTVKLTRQDFLPDRTADGDLLFIFSGNILDFRRNLSSYFKFGSRHEDSSRFYR